MSGATPSNIVRLPAHRREQFKRPLDIAELCRWETAVTHREWLPTVRLETGLGTGDWIKANEEGREVILVLAGPLRDPTFAIVPNHPRYDLYGTNNHLIAAFVNLRDALETIARTRALPR